MKALIRPLVFSGLALVASTGLRAQTADEIVDKYVDAIGGKSAIGSINSLVIESSVNVMGTDAPSKTYILPGKGFKSETDFNGNTIVNCVTDKGAWGINPMAGQTSATALPDAQAKTMRGGMYIGGPLVDYASKGYKVELAGKDGSDYKLKVTSAGGVNVVYYINTSTYLIDKSVANIEMGGQSVEVSTVFGDYRKTGEGVTLPYKQDVSYPQFTVSITNTKIEANKTVDPAIFEMPK
ncbi:MAG: DUF4292 domain-containing protein [Bacteroidetes bacterium]|nr:DUF4292 domain-containing protein [Bacteroidota bacterium]